MPKYVVLSNHPPNSCPSSNKALRLIGEGLGETIQELMKKYNIQPVEILHLDPGHKVLWVLNAPSAEAVRDMINDGGFARWNDFEFYFTRTLDETVKDIRKQPTVW